MENPEAKTNTGSKSLRVPVTLVLFAFIVLMGLWFYNGCQSGPDESLLTTQPAVGQSQPGATTGISTQAARQWEPPKFTNRQGERDAMVAVIRRYPLRDKAVLAAMAAVPRHEFVTSGYQSSAYEDRPLPIGYGQTISQPYMVAEMTRVLKLKSDSRVLEIGTGSGYQAAVLTHFTPYVYTIEIVKPLADAVAKRFKRLGYSVVQTRHGDGYHGWPGMTFDAIIVTCAAGQIPPPLLKQLAPGGRMVIPVGRPSATQFLMLVEKDKDGVITSRNLMGVRFVPLIRKSGYNR
jgi:protein-L-isoaspartate(D-aspartate) O-methyltransferase